ncbi:hypothetical protein C791_0648 [Amycolatopsis azurea DSM 43854]|uniref:Uncharacterized protein n=1 Tax=Amycolatopsis azurea DSM 43854 TaxID=1238180 RepID=M2QRW7_9PSEU|nr:hypothetical protein C791_0648 [Amycolatopsis azurea DSM 43854]
MKGLSWGSRSVGPAQRPEGTAERRSPKLVRRYPRHIGDHSWSSLTQPIGDRYDIVRALGA